MHLEILGTLETLDPATTADDHHILPTQIRHLPHLDEATAVTNAHRAILTRTPTIRTMKTTHVDDIGSLVAATVRATSPKATNQTVTSRIADVGIHTTTTVIVTVIVETDPVGVTETADTAMTATMTAVTTTCSTTDPAAILATLATTTGHATDAATTTAMKIATATVVGAVETQRLSLSGRNKRSACSRTMHYPLSRKRVPSTCRSRWQMALESVEEVTVGHDLMMG